MVAKSVREGVMVKLSWDSMLTEKELNIMINRPSTDNCIIKIKRNFRLFRVFFNSHQVIVLKFILILPENYLRSN